MSRYDEIDPPTARVTLTFLVDAWSDERVDEALETITEYLDKHTLVRGTAVDWNWA